jgi:hypothetical protein
VCREEGVAILEKDQEFDPAVPYHWHRIYTIGLVGAQGLRLEGDATIHVFFQIYLKDDHYSSMWLPFLCPPRQCEQLLADQELYARRCYKTLVAHHGSYGHEN